jgi:hypothetical protein
LGSGAAPAVPTGLVATAGNRKITCNWMPVAGAASYNFWSATNASRTFNLIATGLTASSFVDTNAISGITNYYAVSAVSACGYSVNSAAVGVFLPKPVIGFSLSAGLLTLSWPGWANDWVLYATTNLTSPIFWVPITNVVGSNNAQFNVTLPVGSGSQFFRLTGN